MNIGDYPFEGPYISTSYLENRSGVYAILDKKQDKYHVIDIGESSGVKDRVDSHDRKDCWERRSNSSWVVAVYYTPNLQQSGRMEIEQKLRKLYSPPCGER